MRCLLGIALLIFMPIVLAENFYLDISYKNGSLTLPEKSSKLVKLFKKDNKSILVTASILSRNDSKEVILVPPVLLENFELVGEKLNRIKTEDIVIKRAHFKDPAEQLILKVDFFSVDKSNVTAFSKGLENMAKAYAAATLSSTISDVAQAALDLVTAALLTNKEVSLSYKGGIDLEKGKDVIKLYFDDSGSINEDPIGESKTAATIKFDVDGYSERKVFFELAFKKQTIDEQAKVLFDKFISVSSANASSIDKKDACDRLYDHLKLSNNEVSATNLIAIAINDARWAQDETNYWCLKPDIAINYRIKHGLHRLIRCVKNSCLLTKRLILVSQGVTDYSKLKPFTGGEDINEMGCFSSLKPKRIYSWKGFEPDSIGEGFDTYRFTTCLETEAGSDRYEHTITWFDEKVFSHSCEESETVKARCK